MYQGTNEASGTPSHTTTAVVHRTKADLAARSLRRELVAVTSEVQTITKWRDEVETHMSQNNKDMAEVQKKLDLLLGVILPTGSIRASTLRTGFVSATPQTLSPPGHTASNITLEKAICHTTDPTGNERTWSGSLYSEEICPGLPIGSPAGML